MWKSLRFSTLLAARDAGHEAAAAGTAFNTWPLSEALVLVVGLFALLCDFLQISVADSANLHLLFGLVLLAVTVQSSLRTLGMAHHIEPQELSLRLRCQARRIYFLLYALAALRVCIFVVEHVANRCTADCPRTPQPRSLDDFLVYVGFGAAAVGLVRLFALLAPVRIRD